MQPRLKRPALIASSKKSIWLSCTIITPNIEKVYRKLLGKNLKLFNFTDDFSPMDYLCEAKKIFAYAPTAIIFLDHYPHPSKMLAVLYYIFNRRLPPVYIHVYGCFMIHPESWINCSKYFRELTFICASTRQKQLVQSTVVDKRSVQCAPFPIDEKIFFANAAAGINWRKSIKIPLNAKVILYSGRISPEKNVILLLKNLCKMMTEDPAIYFVIAGNFDDIGPHKFGKQYSPGYFKRKWDEEYLNIPNNVKKRIVTLGPRSQSELHSIYNASNVFVSLSVYHDEDFGMAPVEALMSGVPTVLTNWGGYASFKVGKNPSVKLIDLELTELDGYLIDNLEIQEAIKEQMELSLDKAQRTKRAIFYKKRYSIEASCKTYEKIYKIKPYKFRGFKKFLYRYNAHFQEFSAGKKPLFLDKPKKSGLYYDIYKHYLGA